MGRFRNKSGTETSLAKSGYLELTPNLVASQLGPAQAFYGSTPFFHVCEPNVGAVSVRTKINASRLAIGTQHIKDISFRHIGRPRLI